MAGNDAVIRVLADITKAERGIEQLVSKLNGIKTTVLDIQTGQAAVKAERVVSSITNRLATLGREARTSVGQVQRLVEGVGTLAAGGTALGATSNALGSIASKAQAAAVALDNASDSIRGGFGLGGLKSLLSAASGQFEGFASTVQTTGNALGNFSAPIQAMIDGFSAIGPSATLAAGGIALLGAAMNDVLSKEVASIGDNATAALRGMTDEVQALLRALSELNQQGGTLNQFKDLQKRGYARLNDNNSGTVEAAKAANTIVRAEEKITAEKKAQNDLLRAARGLQPQSVRDAEVSRRQALLTSGRNQEKLLATQAQETEQLQQALLKLEQASAELENGKLAERWKLDQAAAAKLREETEALAAQLQLMDRAANNKGIRLTEAKATVQERKELEQSIKLIRERNALLQGNANQYRGMAGPGNDTRVNQPQYRAMVNQRAVTEASKTLQIQYNWNQALKQGATIAADMRRIQAEDLKLQQQKVAKAYEQLAIKKREEDFERRLARLRQRNNERDQARKDFSDKAQGVAIGGAFPLLFGGGAGSVIGGALGGLNTKNPIFSVFTSAIGQMLDQWVATTTDLAKSLKNPTDAMAALEAAGYKVSDSTKNQVNRLLEVGRAYEAQSVVLAEVERKMGAGSVQGLNALAGEQKKLQDQWDQMAGALQGELLPALVGTIALLNSLAAGAKVLSKLQLPKWFINFLTVTNPGFALSRAQFEDAQRRGRDVASRAPTRPALDPLVAQDAADKRLAAAERAEALRRQGLQLERQASDLRLQIEDQVYGFRQRAADIERANLDLRRSIEDEIFKKRQDITRLETDNARQQAQLAIERLDLQLAGTRGNGNAPGQDLANQLTDAVRQYVKTRAEGEADLRQKERLHVIDMEELKRAAEKFRFDVARKVADLERQGVELNRDIERAKLTTARAIYDLQVAGADYQVAKAKESLSTMVEPTQRLAATGAVTQQVRGGTASGVYYQGGIGPRGANQYGPHFDIKRSDGGYFPRNSLDRYVSVNGRPLSSGVTVPGGEYGAPRSYGGHAGWDYAFGGRAGLTLQNGAKWTGSSRGGYGDSTAFMTPDGKVYKIIHGTFQPGAAGIPSQAVATPAAVAAAPSVPRPGLPASVGQAGAALGSVKLPGPADVSGALTSLSALDAKLLSAKTNALEIAKAFSQLSKEKAAEALGTSVQSVIGQLNAPLDQLLQSQADSAAYQREYAELIMQGTTPALAEQLTQIRQQVQLQLEQLNTAVLQLEATKAKLESEGKWTAELQTQLELLKAQQGVIAGKGAAAEGFAVQDQKGKKVREYMTRLRGELNDTDAQIVSLAGTIESELGSAMSNAISGLIDGTMTAQQAFSQMFKNIGAAFIDMATQMIAKALVMKVLGILGGGVGGGLGGGFGGTSSLFSPGSFGFSPSGGMKFFADGGFVTGPTPAVVGEAGSEYVIPAAKMGEAMSRYAAGRRGSSVIPDSGESGGGGTSDGALNISYSVTEINSMRFVTEDQFQQGMATAAQRGASGGHARVMGDLRNKRSTRARLGIS